jgi:hypothetical protein
VSSTQVSTSPKAINAASDADIDLVSKFDRLVASVAAKLLNVAKVDSENRVVQQEIRARRASESFQGFRFLYLRHQAITEMAEAGAPDATIMAVAEHLDRAMMEH